MDFFRRLESLAGKEYKKEQAPASLTYEEGQSVWLERINFPPIKGRVVKILDDGRVEVVSDIAAKDSLEAKSVLVNKKNLDVWQHRNK
jgi:hypothetical protein